MAADGDAVAAAAADSYDYCVDSYANADYGDSLSTNIAPASDPKGGKGVPPTSTGAAKGVPAKGGKKGPPVAGAKGKGKGGAMGGMANVFADIAEKRVDCDSEDSIAEPSASPSPPPTEPTAGFTTTQATITKGKAKGAAVNIPAKGKGKSVPPAPGPKGAAVPATAVPTAGKGGKAMPPAPGPKGGQNAPAPVAAGGKGAPPAPAPGGKAGAKGAPPAPGGKGAPPPAASGGKGVPPPAGKGKGTVITKGGKGKGGKAAAPEPVVIERSDVQKKMEQRAAALGGAGQKKKLHWSEMRSGTIELPDLKGTVWSNVSEMNIDDHMLKQLTSQFTSQLNQPNNPAAGVSGGSGDRRHSGIRGWFSGGRSSGSATPQTEMSVSSVGNSTSKRLILKSLNDKDRRNFAIAFSRMPDCNKLTAGLLLLNEETLSEDQIEMLKGKSPTPAQVKEIEKLDSQYPSKAWDKAEGYLRALLKVSHCEIRLRCWLMVRTIPNQLTNINKWISDVELGCYAVQNSEGIKVEQRF